MFVGWGRDVKKDVAAGRDLLSRMDDKVKGKASKI